MIRAILLLLATSSAALACPAGIQGQADDLARAGNAIELERLQLQARACPQGVRNRLALLTSTVLWNGMLRDGVEVTSDEVVERVHRVRRAGGLWQASEFLGDHYRGREEWSAAYQAYEEAIALAEAPQPQRSPLTAEEIRRLVDKRDIAFALARHHGESVPVDQRFRSSRASIIAVGRERVPIQFGFDQDEPTPQGWELLEEMAREIITNQPPSVRLMGHTDDVGSAEYNMDLSRRRAERVGRALIARGYEGHVRIEAYGLTQPFPRGPATEGLSDDQYRALCRRVEYVMEFD